MKRHQEAALYYRSTAEVDLTPVATELARIAKRHRMSLDGPEGAIRLTSAELVLELSVRSGTGAGTYHAEASAHADLDHCRAALVVRAATSGSRSAASLARRLIATLVWQLEAATAAEATYWPGSGRIRVSGTGPDGTAVAPRRVRTAPRARQTPEPMAPISADIHRASDARDTIFDQSRIRCPGQPTQSAPWITAAIATALTAPVLLSGLLIQAATSIRLG